MWYLMMCNQNTQHPMEVFVRKETSIMQLQIKDCFITMRQQKLLVYYVEEQTAIMKI